MSSRNKTLAHLLGIAGERPPSDGMSPLNQALYSLLDKPIGKFGVEDLRLAIGQDLGLEYLIPLAISFLEKDPLCEGMHYKGDLLCNVLRVNPNFYKKNPGTREKIEAIVTQAGIAVKSLGRVDAKCLGEALAEAMVEFERSAQTSS